MGRNQHDDDTLDDLRDEDGQGGTQTEAELEGQSDASDSSTKQDRDADDTGDGAEGQRAASGLQKRLSKVSALRRKAEEERDALKARVDAYVAKEREESERRRAAEQATPEGQKAAERRQAIRAALDEAYGEGTSELLASQRAERELQREAYAQEAVSHLKSELEDHGIVADDKTLIRWERAVGSEIQEDRELFAMYRRPATKAEAIREAFKRVNEGLVSPLVKQQGGKPLERIERNRGAVLGGRQAAAPENPFPEDYTPKGPPKNATPAEQEAYWQNHRDELWKKLNAREQTA